MRVHTVDPIKFLWLVPTCRSQRSLLKAIISASERFHFGSFDLSFVLWCSRSVCLASFDPRLLDCFCKSLPDPICWRLNGGYFILVPAASFFSLLHGFLPMFLSFPVQMLISAEAIGVSSQLLRDSLNPSQYAELGEAVLKCSLSFPFRIFS